MYIDTVQCKYLYTCIYTYIWLYINNIYIYTLYTLYIYNIFIDSWALSHLHLASLFSGAVGRGDHGAVVLLCLGSSELLRRALVEEGHRQWDADDAQHPFVRFFFCVVFRGHIYSMCIYIYIFKLKQSDFPLKYSGFLLKKPWNIFLTCSFFRLEWGDNHTYQVETSGKLSHTWLVALSMHYRCAYSIPKERHSDRLDDCQN